MIIIVIGPLSGWLLQDILDFVNVSNPAAAALTSLLTGAAPTVQAATAISVSASIAASTAASAAGGAAGGGAGPGALAGAQRNALMSLLGGAPRSCEDPRSTGNGGGWMMGRLGVVNVRSPCTMNMSANASFTRARRQLASGQSSGGGAASSGGGGASSGSKASQDEAIKVEPIDDQDLMLRLLVVQLEDTLVSVAMIVGSVFGAHFLILLLWKFACNRRYYTWVKRTTPRLIHIQKEAGAPLGIGNAALQYVKPLHHVKPFLMRKSIFRSPAHMLALRFIHRYQQGSHRHCECRVSVCISTTP